MRLNTSAYRRSVEALSRTLRATASYGEGFGHNTDTWEAMRGGVIKAFEVCYELAWKLMQRWISLNSQNDETQQMTKKDLFRRAAQLGLIEDPEKWFKYHDLRNLTAHTYKEQPAEEIYNGSEDFLREATALLMKFEASDD